MRAAYCLFIALVSGCGAAGDTSPTTSQDGGESQATDAMSVIADNEEASGRALEAKILAFAFESSIRVEVSFPTGPSGSRMLADSDRLTATVKGIPTGLALDMDPFGHPMYAGIVQGSRQGTHVLVQLESAEFGEASVDLVLPDPLQLESPRSGEPIELAKPVELRWSGGQPSDVAEVGYLLKCDEGGVHQGASAGPDLGKASIEVDTSNMQGFCDLTVRTDRLIPARMQGSWYGSASGAQRGEAAWLIRL